MKNRVQRKPTELPTRNPGGSPIDGQKTIPRAPPRKSPGTTEVQRFNEAEADERARRRLRRRPSPTKQEPPS